MPDSTSSRARGQVVLVLLFMILGLLFLALVNVDVFLAIRGKGRLQNAGDAAALAAARWQGVTLNALGALNLAQIDLACRHAENPGAASELIAALQHLQERLVFAGPLAGLHAAQCAARANGATPDPDMAGLVNEAVARADAYVIPSASWPEKAQDYAAMLRAVLQDGAYAGCENARYYNYGATGSHPLYDKAFYAAVNGEDWCWFFLRDDMMALLSDFSGWGEIPVGAGASPQNPEFYGVDVTAFHGALRDLDPDRDRARMHETVLALAARAGCTAVTDFTLSLSGVVTNDVSFTWIRYGDDWRAWTEMSRGGDVRLPLRGDVRPQYDLFGAAAAARVTARLTPVTPDVKTRDNVWTAAAKPFGEIDGRTVTLDGLCPLVTPAFTAVRLIPLAGASEQRLNMADRNWVSHTRDHARAVAEGVYAGGCSYCSTLRTWADDDFRSRGLQWLADNSNQCRLPTGGSTPGGGSPYGH